MISTTKGTIIIQPGSRLKSVSWAMSAFSGRKYIGPMTVKR